MPASLPLELREEFRQPHMRGTAIELRHRQGTGWTQGHPWVFLGQRGRGKSHISSTMRLNRRRRSGAVCCNQSIF